MKNKILQYLIIILNVLNAQGSYQILNLSSNARSLSLNNSESNFQSIIAANNPASISTKNDVKSYSYFLLPANIHYIGFQNIKKNQNRINATRISYINYGLLVDSKTNYESQAYEILIEQGSKSELYNIISMGISGGLLLSSIADYKSSVIFLDIGFRTEWVNTLNKKIGLGLSIENLGRVIKTYTNIKEDLPTLLSLGSYYELKYIPATLSINYINNYNFNNTNYFTGGIEFKLDNNFSFRLSTGSDSKDFLNRDFTSDILSGVSAGLGFNILDINYDIGFKNLGSSGYIIGFSFIKTIR